MTNLLRPDLAIIAGRVPEKSRVIDIGCGAGELLHYLAQTKNCTAQGMEISPAGVALAVAKGLSVIQGNADTDLGDFPDRSFDVAILSQTLQATLQPALVLEELLRVAKTAIVSFPNFGFWRARVSIALSGRMPVTPALPINWYDTPNIHLCTVRDFEQLCADKHIKVEKTIFLRGQQPISPSLANLLAEQAIFILSR
jgi:methionine biosynthesis protein MetW